MSIIDSRVVQMTFDGTLFKKGIQSSMNALKQLTSGVKNGIQSLTEFKNKLNFNSLNRNFSLSGIENGINNISEKFSAMGVIGITALQNITNSAIDAGKKIANALTLEPLQSGFQEYETQINAVQTILSNTKSKGSTIEDVNNALDELNKYADMTIYNFTEMTRNIGTFTAAGIGLDESVSAIKGIANLAAMSGSTSQQASTAMYQLSQALASGTVKLQDWNSVVNAGMGGQLFQDALKETAKKHNVAIDEMIEKQGSFRNTLQEGWLTAEILTETLDGFAKDQDAIDAATKVKTFTQLVSTLKEAMQSGWTQSWEIIIGDFEEAKQLLTEISDTLGEIINNSSDERNTFLESWSKLGGRDSLIEAAKNSMNAVINICKNVKKAFRDVFPAITAEQLFSITESIKKLTEKFKMLENMKLTFFKEVLSVVKKVTAAVSELLKEFYGSGGVADIIETVKNIFASVIKVIRIVGSAFAEVFLPIKLSAKPLATLAENVKKLSGIFLNSSSAAYKMKDALIKSFNILKQAFTKVVSFLKTAAGKINETLKNVFNFSGNVLSDISGFFSTVLKKSSSFAPVFEQCFEGAKGIILKFSEIVKKTIPVVVSFISKSVSAVSGFMQRFAELGGIKRTLDLIKNAFASVTKIAHAAFEAFTEVFSSLGITAENVYSLVDYFAELTEAFANSDHSADTLKSVFKSVFTLAKTLIQTVGTLAKVIANAAISVIPLLTSAFSSGVSIFSSFIGQAISLAGQVLPVLVNVLSTVVSVISAFLRQALNLSGDILPGLVSAFGKVVRAVSSFVTEFISMGGLSAAAGAIKNIFRTIEKVFGIAKNSFEQVMNPIGSAARSVYSLVEKIRQLTGAFLNSEDAAYKLQKIFTGIFAAFKAAISTIKKLLTTFSELTAKALPAFQNGFAKLFPEGFEGLVSGITNKISGLAGMVQEIAGTKGTYFTDLVSVFTKGASAVANFVKRFSELGGFSSVAETLRNLFGGLLKIIGLISDAFSEIFSSIGDSGGGADTVYNLVEKFRQLSANFLNSGAVADKLKRIFKGVFALIDIGINVVKTIAGSFSSLAESAAPAGEAFLEAAARLGDFIVRIDNALRENDFFKTGIESIIQILKSLVDTALTTVNSISENFSGFGDAASQFCAKLKTAFDRIGSILTAASESICSVVKSISENLTFDDLLNALNAGALTAIIFSIKEFIDGIKNIGDSGFLGRITSVFDTAKESLESWQKSLNVSILKNIAVAVGILAGSLLLLSVINAEKLDGALTAVTMMLAELMGCMALFTKMSGAEGFTSIAKISSALTGLSASVLILSFAVEKMSALNIEQLFSGLLGAGAIMAGLWAFLKFADLDKASMTKSVGLVALAGALYILADVTEKIGSLNIDQIIKGLAGIAVLLTEIGVFISTIGNASKVISNAVGLVVLGSAMIIFASAISRIGSMSLTELCTGLGGIGAALLIIAGAATLMPKNLLSTGAGLIAIAAAINILSQALIQVSSISFPDLIKSLLAIGVALLEIAGAATLMPKNLLATGAGITVLSFGLLTLSQALQAIGEMSVEDIFKSLLTIAAVLAMLGVAATVLTPMVPAVLAMAAAMLAMGLAVALVGAGLSALTVALATLAGGLAAFTVSLDAILKGLADIVVVLVDLVCELLIESAPALCRALEVIVVELCQALGPMGVELLNAVDVILVKLIDLVMNALMALLERITAESYKIIDCVMKIIYAILKGIADNLENIITAAVAIVTALIYGINSGLNDLVQAVFDLVIEVINITANKLRDNIEPLLDAIANLVDALVYALIETVKKSDEIIRNVGMQIGEALVDGVKDLLGINSPSTEFEEIGGFVIEGLTNGIENNLPNVKDAAGSLGDTVMSSMDGVADNMSDIFSDSVDTSSLDDMSCKISDIFSDDVDFSPTVTPVLDLTNVESGAKDVNNILSDSGYNAGSLSISADMSSSAVQSALADMDNGTNNSNISATIDKMNSDVCGRIDSINANDKIDNIYTRLGELESAITNMKIVLDTGTLAGAVTKNIDTGLGRTASAKTHRGG